MNSLSPSHPLAHPERTWSGALLTSAAVYNLLWGLLAMAIPARLSQWIGFNQNISPFALQVLGAFTFGLGCAYAFAALDPFRQWVITLTGFLYGVAGSFLLGLHWLDHSMEPGWASLALGNWFIWTPLLGIVLFLIYRNGYRSDNLLIETFSSPAYPLDLFDTTSGDNLMDLSRENKVLLVFLRHFGCPFCKDTMDHIASVRKDFDRCGVRIVLVYMIPPSEAQVHLQQYGLDDLDQISDPESMLYKKFRLRKGRVMELFGPKALLRFGQLLWTKHYLIGKEAGDSLQMPGVFLLQNGQILSGFIHDSAADRPDFDQILEVCCT